jgi:hypothetical protein
MAEALRRCLARGLPIPLKCFDVAGYPVSSQVTAMEKNGYLVSVCAESADDFALACQTKLQTHCVNCKMNCSSPPKRPIRGQKPLH